MSAPKVAVATDTAPGAADPAVEARLREAADELRGPGRLELARTPDGRVSFTFFVEGASAARAEEACVAAAEDLLRLAGAVHTVLDRVVVEPLGERGGG